MPISRLLLLGTLLGLLGCGKQAPAPQIAIDPNEQKDRHEHASPKEHGVPETIAFRTMDLRRYGIVGAIDVPEGAKVENVSNTVVITHDLWFRLEIGKSVRSLVEKKGELARNHPGCVFTIDEPDAVMVASSTLPVPQIYARVKLEDREYEITNERMTERVSKQALARMLESARSLRLTEGVKQAILKEEESIGQLRSLGFVCYRMDRGWRVTISTREPNEKIVSLLKDLSWVKEIKIEADVPITAQGMNAIAEIPDVANLSLDRVKIDDELLAQVGKMTSLIDLRVDARRLTDAGIAPLAALTRLNRLNLNGGRSSANITGAGLACLNGMTELETLDLTGLPVRDEGLIHIGKCPKLQLLYLRNTRITDKGLAHLRELTQLRRLDLGETSITNLAFFHLSKLKRLMYLTIAKTAITGLGLRHLKTGCVALDKLDVSDTFLNDEGLAELKGIPLIHLEASRTSITHAGCAALAGSTSIGMLGLSENALTDAVLVHLGKIPHLNELRLDGTAVIGSGLEQLAPCLKLSILTLGDTPLNDVGLSKLPSFPELTVLELGSTLITDAGLAGLKDCPKLNYVSVRDTAVTKLGVDRFTAGRNKVNVRYDSESKPVQPAIPVAELKPADAQSLFKRFGIEPQADVDAPGRPVIGLSFAAGKINDLDLAQLRELKNLKRLNLEGCEGITDAGLPYLSGLLELEELDLAGTSVKGDGLIYLKSLTKLRRLALPQHSLNRRQLQPLNALKNLEKLEFDAVGNTAIGCLTAASGLEELFIGGNINNQGLICLKTFKNLRRLTVSSERVSDLGLAHIASLPELERLTLVKCRVSDGGLTHLKETKKLMELHLPGKFLTDEGMSRIKDIDHLAKFYLSDGAITDRGLRYLGEMRNLDTLIIPGAKITDAGLTAFRDAEELRTLDFSDTAVTGQGFAALDASKIIAVNLTRSRANDAGVGALSRLKNLQTLQLSQTEVTDAGISKLKKHPALTSLHLDDNTKITDAALESIRLMPKLESINLRNTSVTEKGVSELRKSRPDLKIDFKD